MNLKEHAINELKIGGFYEENDDGIGKMVINDVLELIEVFSKQGHSGSSAPFVLNLFHRLASYGIISPLTGEDDEWEDVSHLMGSDEKGKIFQNKRYSSVFKENGKAYDTRGKVFVEIDEYGDRTSYTSRESRVDIEFPYSGLTEYIHIDTKTGEQKSIIIEE